VEFSEEHAGISLRDLGLVPNGSLVVKVLPAAVSSGQCMLGWFTLDIVKQSLLPDNVS